MPREESAVERSKIDVDSDSPYENRNYIQSKTRDALKRDAKRQAAAISPQDLHESFVESPGWHDDFEDDTKVRFGRGLKAVDETLHGANEIHERGKLEVVNVTANLEDPPSASHDNSSTFQNRYRNTTVDIINVLGTHRDVTDRGIKKTRDSILTNIINMEGDGDLQAAEQKHVDHPTPRIRRAAASYQGFYDDADGSSADRLRFPDVFKDQSDDVHLEYATSNWHDGVSDRYSKRLGNAASGKREEAGKAVKKRKKGQLSANISGRQAKKGNGGSQSSWNNRRNRRHRTHRSHVSKNANRGDWKLKSKNKRRKQKENRVKASHSSKRSSNQKSRMTDQESLRASLNDASDARVLYENADDQSVSVNQSCSN